MILYESDWAFVLWDEQTQSVIVRRKEHHDYELPEELAELVAVPQGAEHQATQWQGILRSADALIARN
jgi:hypothetical protein